MLRSAIISLLVLFVLTGGFLIYWHMQPPTPPSAGPTDQSISATPPSDSTQNQIGPGHTAWAYSYSNGRLSSQFKADEYTPMAEAGKFKVVRPVRIFYLAHGQFLLIRGDEGIVHVDNGGRGANQSVMDSTVPQSPDSGLLQHVRIELYPTRLSRHPTLWLSTNNIAFDSETLRLYTQSFVDPNGVTVPGDQVPVIVRGDDYEFDGNGLTMHWNDRDDQLQLMEIAHGRRLEVKNPRMLTPTSAQQEEKPQPNPPAEVPSQPSSAVTVAAPPPTNRPAAPAKKAAETIYQAIFHDDVQVFQGDLQVAKAATMTVDFLPAKPKEEADDKSSSTQPATTEPFEIEPEAPPAAEQQTVATTEATAPHPTTNPKNEPITITWNGKLHITPLADAPIMPLNPGQTVARLEGSPVELTPQGSIIHAAAVVYRSDDGAIRLENSTDVPKFDLKRTQDGATFSADSLNYDPATSLATIAGPGQLNSPTQDKTGNLSAAWAGQGLFHLVGKLGDPKSFVDHVELFDNVSIDHPKMSLTSSKLVLDLEKEKPKTPSEKSGEQLKRVTANGNVVCRLKESGQPTRGIDSDDLVLAMAPGLDGKPVPHTIVADGNVHAFDPQQQLQAGHLEAVLLPKPPTATAKKPKGNQETDEALDVDSMFATTAVHAILKNGSTADSDKLRLTTVDGHHQIELDGAASPATLTNPQQSTLHGQVIHISPDEDQQAVVVDGPGTAHTMHKVSATQPARPVDLSWTDSLNGNGAANTVEVHGNVTGRMIDAQSDTDTVTSDSAYADLMDVKTPAKAKRTTQPGDADQLSGKQLKVLTLKGNVHGESILTDPDGTLLVRRALVTTMLIHDAQKGRTTIPAPGTIWLEDHRKPTTTNTTGDATTGNNRGKMAIKWDGSLVYDQPTNQIVFDRNVNAAFLQDAKDAVTNTLICQRLTADLKSIPGTSSSAEKTQLQHVRAEGAVQFTSKAMNFTATTVDYDPTTSRMTAHGTPDLPGKYINEQDGSSGTFQELIYNVQTQQPEIIKGGEGEVRH